MPSRVSAVNCQCCIVGAGPAGLSTALELARRGLSDVVVVDRRDTVGGLSRTATRDGCRYDVGPHRFFTTNREVGALWRETLGSDFLPVKRLTRIYHHGSFFHYPIKAFDALSKLGPFRAAQALASYLRAQTGPVREARSFEDWIVDRFGKVLFEDFFKEYTEKVWGIPCNQIGTEWAAQRIRGLDLLQVMKKALRLGNGVRTKTLVDRFHYPRQGAGQMYEALAERAAEKGVRFLLGCGVERFLVRQDRVCGIEVVDSDDARSVITADHYFNSAPLTHFFTMTDQPVDSEVETAAQSLRYRDHIAVNLVVDSPDVFPDQWLYIHATDVRLARIANYGNFSPAMVGHRPKTALSVEYFAFQHEPFFQMRDADLIGQATQELAQLGLVAPEAVESGWVGRETECYPSYVIGFEPHYERLCRRIDRIGNLTPIGRAGMYKYNNMDHSMLSGLMAARNYLGSGVTRNLWHLNTDTGYQESGTR